MESVSANTSRPTSAAPTPPTGKAAGTSDRPPERIAKFTRSARQTYKEKYLAMQEKYTQVSETHQAYEKELALADEKLRKLQDECNLLLDAVDIAAPAQPSLMHYLQRDPIAPQYHSYQVPFPAVQPEPAQAPAPTLAPISVAAPVSHPPPLSAVPSTHENTHSSTLGHRPRQSRRSTGGAQTNGNGVNSRRKQ